MNFAETTQPYILGLDIGVASIGWVRLSLNKHTEPSSILDAGVHTFDAGVEGDVESGRDEARGRARREARLPRRMIERRQRRRRKILRLLQRSGLLPPGDIRTCQSIHDYLLGIDANLREKHSTSDNRISAHVLPYKLRAAALDQPLDAFDLGRAFYHLAQRRGFLSNRKSLKQEEDEGVVKQGITELQEAMDAAGARTLGEHLAKLDAETDRIRRRWTARSMYIDEFKRICDAQRPHHPKLLTREFIKSLFRAIFFQRPLKSARHLIGRCELVPGARRAAMADRLFQRFRILQNVNNLVVTPPDAPSRPLNDNERKRLIEALYQQGDVTFAKIRSKSILGLPKGTELKVWGQDEEKKLPGHRTDEKMRTVFGQRWDQMSESERDAIVLEIVSFQNPDALARRALKAWGLDEQDALKLAETRLEQGYAAHSRRALRRLVERMEDGTPYATARRELFPESFRAIEPVDRLPPVLKAVPSLRNPAVSRALTELRKLINEIIRVHGKPQQVRIELARDLKRGRKERKRFSKDIDARTKLREKAKERILREAGLADPRRPDIEKALLWEECGGKCPYTGRSIEFASLFGANPQFDVEHILPFSRSLDNSFANKTLCYHQENRDRKRNRTPYEAYGTDPDRYADILARVHAFQGQFVSAKLRRFEMNEIPEDFVNRQLADTRYASRLAGDYLSLLYGGRSDASGRLRIQISTGGITAHIRDELKLNSLFDEFARELAIPSDIIFGMTLEDKKRVNHRHHAVDALAVALASPGLVHKLQRAAERASETGRERFAPVPEPWAGFLHQAREKFLQMKVSSRLTKKLAGDLHEDTNYSKEYQIIGKKGKPVSVRHVRKPLESITEPQVDDIVDPVVREKVRAWMTTTPAKSRKDTLEFPTVRTHDGRLIPIKSVRLRKVVTVEPVGEGPRTRYVKPGSNHHTVIVATVDAHGKEIRRDDCPVTRLDVHRRKAAGQPIVQNDWGPGRKFKFSLTANEYLLINDDDGTEKLIRCISVSERANEFRVHCDARPATEARKRGSGARIRLSGEGMRRANARKVRVTYLGHIIPAND